VWKGRARARRPGGDWPSPDQVDEVIADRRARLPAEPAPAEVTELADLLMLRGLRDVELGRLDSAVADLREAHVLAGEATEQTDPEVAQRRRAITVGLARAEVKAGHVAEAIAALTEVRSLPYPHTGSESRATVRLLLDVNELRSWAHRQRWHEQGLRLALQGHALAAGLVAHDPDRTHHGLEVPSLVFLASSYAATGDVDHALATADGAITLMGTDPDARATLLTTLRMKARLLRGVGRSAEADAVDLEAVELERS
jgi:hypothetical protein